MKEAYRRRKQELLSDRRICSINRAILREYFDWHETKLKRINDLRELDDACYRTLSQYVSMFKNVNAWFNNKPFKNITREDIRRVYNGLEDGQILTLAGRPFQDRASYYSKIFKSKFFKMIGKYEYADDIMEFSKPTKNRGKVRFFSVEEFEKLVSAASRPQHRLLLWLAWDIGENVAQTLLRLQKRDLRRRVNPDTNQPEYLVNLPQEKIKRSRTPRAEPTNYPETARCMDIILETGKRSFVPNKKGKETRKPYDDSGARRRVKGDWIVRPFADDDLIFDFEQKQAEKVFRQCVDKTGVKCEPNGEMPTLKDLRSSMACHLLREGWSIDEVKARMGHKPSSSVIDRYATYLAMDRHKPKKKLFDNALIQVQKDLEQTKQREKLQALRVDNQKSEIDKLKREMEKRREFDDILADLAEDPVVLRKAMQAMVKLSGQKTHSGR